MKTTAERLNEVLKIKNLKQIDILRLAEPYCQKYMVKLNKSDLSQFIHGKVTPGQFKLKILALALGVNEAWLMGYEDVPMERDHSDAPDLYLSDFEREIITKLRLLSVDQQKVFLAYLTTLLNTQAP